MRKARAILPVVLPALAILAVLTVSSQAEKPSSPPGQPKPEPVPSRIEVGGAIRGEGDPKEIPVTFFDSSLLTFEYPLPDSTQGPLFISNPDYPPSLTVSGPGMNMKQLKYYYCVHASHVGQSERLCGDPVGHKNYYYCLLIGGGVVQKKSPTSRVTFAAGSPWRLSSKATMSTVATGTLSAQATYDVTAWSTPASAE